MPIPCGLPHLKHSIRFLYLEEATHLVLVYDPLSGVLGGGNTLVVGVRTSLLAVCKCVRLGVKRVQLSLQFVRSRVVHSPPSIF